MTTIQGDDNFANHVQLPPLTSVPTSLPTCCVSLSIPLISALKNAFSEDSSDLVLSVGSGSGLLESYMIQNGINVKGIDLSTNTNQYLEEEEFIGLRGLWDREPISNLIYTRQILFVYPKPIKSVIKRYLEMLKEIEILVWIGPSIDWFEVKETLHQFSDWKNSEMEILNVTEPYERFIIMRYQR
ncbi:hypothetical protein DFH28DRAFT_970748 [Melampsora americana]|nr:hypothetical protein DFH28DRAFT_970748 [Melampsora americana]